jgi:hypothetical protein
VNDETNQGHTTRKRRRKVGDIRDLRRLLWGVIAEVDQRLGHHPTADELTRMGHLLAQLSGSYLKVLETADIVERLKRLERVAAEGHQGGERR